jgi:hypothetical protein
MTSRKAAVHRGPIAAGQVRASDGAANSTSPESTVDLDAGIGSETPRALCGRTKMTDPSVCPARASR